MGTLLVFMIIFIGIPLTLIIWLGQEIYLWFRDRD